MKKRILLGLCILFSSTISKAQVPSTINFQGVLTDTSDDPIEGSFDITFRMYDAVLDGNMIWEELHSSVLVTKGLFNVILGSVEPITNEFNQAYFLSVQKGSESELSPRITLTSVPSSINSNYSMNSESTKSLLGGSNTIPASGNVGIGTTSPLAKMHVEEGGAEDALRIRVAATTKLIVKNDGKVGVATVSPTEALDIDGKIRIRGGVPGAGKVLTSDANGVATWAASSSGVDEITSTGGQIGIGTVSPGSKLSVGGSVFVDGDNSVINANNAFQAKQDLNIDDNDTGFDVPSDGTLTVFTNNVERMRVSSVGQVGIGTTAPNSLFHLNAPSTGDAMRIQLDGNTRFYIAADGQIAVGGFFDPSYPLHVSGDVAGTSFVNTSDRRWKKNIKSFENGLEKVLGLRGVSYDWRMKEFPNKGFEKGGQIGFIAQEVEEVLPDLVSTDDQGFKSVKYANITAVLVEAIKEQQEIIASLQQELNKSKEVQTQFSAELSELKTMMLKEVRKGNKKSLTASN